VPPDVSEKIQAVAIGQAHVGEAKVIPMLLQQLLGIEARTGRIDIEPHAGQCH
jgi:hypothetical protein